MGEANPQSFLTLERSLIARLNGRYQRKVARPVTREISEALSRNDFTRAHEVADRGLDFGFVLDEEPFIQLMGVSAYILGQSFFVRRGFEGELASGREELPSEVEVVSRSLCANLSGAAQDRVQQDTHKVINQAQRLARGEPRSEVFKGDHRLVVEKVADAALAGRLNAAVAAGGQRVIEKGANLTTSRLIQYGSLRQADAQGTRTYQINEVLDSRTCPVCRRMHGRTFTVASALARQSGLLQITDPGELATAAPFPESSKAGIVQLTGLNTSELEARGWTTPPFHPSCRGVLSPVGTVPSSEMVPFTPGGLRAVQGVTRLPAKVPRKVSIPNQFKSVSDDLAAKIKGPKAAQKTNNLDVLFDDAARVDPVLRARITELADEFNGEAIFPPGLKGRARVIEKANAKYGGDFAGITDFSRGTIVFDDLEGVYQTLGKLESKGLKIVRINDRFVAPTAEGYSDVILGVEIEGHVTELQLHVRGVLKAKDANHILYEQQRTIVARAKARPGGRMTATEAARVDDLVTRQQTAYRKAMGEALPDEPRSVAARTIAPREREGFAIQQPGAVSQLEVDIATAKRLLPGGQPIEEG